MTCNNLFRSLLVGAVCSLGALASAGTISPGVFELLDHPDGNLTNSQGPYGLRLDSQDPPPGNGPTFSVEIPAGVVTLTWPGGSTATIEGVLHNNFTGQEWDLTYDLTGVSMVSNGFVASGGSGSLTALALAGPDSDPIGTVITITGEQNNGGDAFVFRADGHRLSGDNATAVGRGWLDANSTNDVLFQAIQTSTFEIPEPTSALLLVSAGLLVGRRRAGGC